MKVLSLFDGISVLRCALGDRKVEYFASEIDKHAISISKKNYPDIVHIGDVTKVKDIDDVYLLCGGSPCQDLSIAKKDRKGLDGERSGLFWEWVRIWKESKPTYFILENVASMPAKDRDIISAELGVQPIMINASLVSAQNRKRLFWTNIPVVGLPVDRGIALKDILEPDAEVEKNMLTKNGKSYCIDANYYKGSSANHSAKKGVRTQVKLIQLGHVGNNNSQANRVYSDEGKSVTLSANGGGLGAKTGLYEIKSGRDIGRRLKDGVRADDDKTIPIQRRIETREDDKTGTLTSFMKDNVVVDTETSKIRKLTPVECERLQSLPDNYTAGISNTQRYRCLGNAFNCEVIKFIISFMPEN
jgi:DNA (cytosine-5)-methyltransferase 3A